MISYTLASHRRNLLWSAFLVHRLSGVCLALFLPLHFWVLSRALHDPAALEGFLKWTDLWYVKLGEYLLVFLLGAHFFGGLRLMAFEALPWSNRQKTFAALAFALSFISATLFLFSAVQYG
jgi:fumarate reductase subunit D